MDKTIEKQLEGLNLLCQICNEHYSLVQFKKDKGVNKLIYHDFVVDDPDSLTTDTIRNLVDYIAANEDVIDENDELFLDAANEIEFLKKFAACNNPKLLNVVRQVA